VFVFVLLLVDVPFGVLLSSFTLISLSKDDDAGVGVVLSVCIAVVDDDCVC